MHKSLADDGILVIGALRWDHLYKNQPTRELIQDGEKINVFDSSEFHNVLRKNKFKPIFYEQVRDINGDSINGDAYLPSIWRK